MENNDTARDQQGSDREYDTRGQEMGGTRGSTQNQEKKIIKINTRVPRVPQWLKIDHTMKLRIPIKKAKELANRLLEMDDDVDVQIRFGSGDKGSVDFRYEPLNVNEQGDGEKSGWGAAEDFSQRQRGGESALGAQAKSERETGWQTGVQTRSAELTEGASRGGAVESGSEETSRDMAAESAAAKSGEETRSMQGESAQGMGRDEAEEEDVSTVMSVECTPYDTEEEEPTRQTG